MPLEAENILPFTNANTSQICPFFVATAVFVFLEGHEFGGHCLDQHHVSYTSYKTALHSDVLT